LVVDNDGKSNNVLIWISYAIRSGPLMGTQSEDQHKPEQGISNANNKYDQPSDEQSAPFLGEDKGRSKNRSKECDYQPEHCRSLPGISWLERETRRWHSIMVAYCAVSACDWSPLP